MAFNGTLNLAAMEPLTPVQVLGLAPSGAPLDMNSVLGFGAVVSTPFRRLRVQGNSNWHVQNTGPVYLGWSGSAGQTPIEILPGEVVWLEAPTGTRLDIKDLFLDGTGTDAVVVVIFK